MMKPILFLLFILTLSKSANALRKLDNEFYNKIKKLSPLNTTRLIVCITKLNFKQDTKCSNFYKSITNSDYNETSAKSYMNQLYELQQEHINHTSFFSRMLGLITFRNILLLLLTVVTIAFIFSFIGNILVLFAAYALVFFHKLFLSRTSFHIYGLVLCYATVYLQYERDIVNTSWQPYYFLENYSVVFGSLVLAALIIDFSKTYIKDLANPKPMFLILSVIYAIIAIIHDHWFIATMSIWLLYAAFGFIMGAMPGGYYTGFDHKSSIERSAITSFILVTFYMLFKTGAIETKHQHIVDLFENGCLFFGTFIGLLALLIITDKYYIYHHLDIKLYVPMQFLMLGSVLVTLYFGLIFNLAIMKGIGGTFGVLWFLDMEYHFLSQFRTGNMLGALFVLMVNIYGLIYYLDHYREFFIF